MRLASVNVILTAAKLIAKDSCQQTWVFLYLLINEYSYIIA